MARVLFSLQKEVVSWVDVKNTLDLQSKFDSCSEDFTKYLVAHLISILSSALDLDRAKVLAFSDSVVNVTQKTSFGEKLYEIEFSDHTTLRDRGFTIPARNVTVMAKFSKPSNVTVVVLKNCTVEISKRVFKLVSSDRGMHVHSTFGGYCFAILMKGFDGDIWDEFQRIMASDKHMNCVRFSWGVPYLSKFDSIYKNGDGVDWYVPLGLQDTAERSLARRQHRVLCLRVHPDHVNQYRFLQDATQDEKDEFAKMSEKAQQALNGAWEKHEEAGAGVRKRKIDGECDWGTFELTDTMDVEFFKIDKPHILSVARQMFQGFLNGNLIQIDHLYYEFCMKNGVRYSAPDYGRGHTKEKLLPQFTNHMEHLRANRWDDYNCIFCKYDMWKDLTRTEEGRKIFHWASVWVPLFSGKAMIGDGGSVNTVLSEHLVAFCNCYFDAGSCEVVKLGEVGDRIAQHNHINYEWPDCFNVDNLEQIVDDPDFFYDNLRHMPGFAGCLSAPADIMYVIAFVISCAFFRKNTTVLIDNKEYLEEFQIGMFVLGPAYRGKSGLLKIVQMILNEKNTVIPDHKLLDGKFLFGMVSKPNLKAMLLDERPKCKDFNPQQLFTWINGEEIHCEEKHKGLLKKTTFRMRFLAAMNAMLPWDIDDAMLRRMIAVDVARFDYTEMQTPPHEMVAAGEIPYIIASLVHCYRRALRCCTTNFWPFVSTISKDICTVHSTCLDPTDYVFNTILKFLNEKVIRDDAQNTPVEVFKRECNLYVATKNKSKLTLLVRDLFAHEETLRKTECVVVRRLNFALVNEEYVGMRIEGVVYTVAAAVPAIA